VTGNVTVQEHPRCPTRFQPIVFRTWRMRKELALIRSRGYALTCGQRVPGAVGVGAPVRTVGGAQCRSPIGCFGADAAIGMEDQPPGLLRLLDRAARQPDMRGGAAARLVGAMLAKGLLQEADADLRKGEPMWRETGHGTTLVATDAGLAAMSGALKKKFGLEVTSGEVERRGRCYKLPPACRLTSSSSLRARPVLPRRSRQSPKSLAFPASASSLPCSRACCCLFP